MYKLGMARGKFSLECQKTTFGKPDPLSRVLKKFAMNLPLGVVLNLLES